MINKKCRDIFSLNERKEGVPLIVVHPYFPYGGASGVELDESLGYQPQFVKKIEEFILKHNGPVVTFEQGSNLDSTMKRYNSIGRRYNTHFVVTKEGDGHLLQLTWDDIYRFLDKYKTDTVLLAGGKHCKDIKTPGCLDYIDIQLKKRYTTTVLDDLTFD